MQSASPASVTWTPLFSESEAPPFRKALASIAAALIWPDLARFCGPGLSRGAAGLSVFFSYLARARFDSRSVSHASSWLSRAVEDRASLHARSVANRELSCFAGLTGIAWAVEHLRGHDHGFEPRDDPRQEIDERLLEYTRSGPWETDYDLVSGLVGHAVYALERRTAPSGRVLLKQVIDRLAGTCVPTPDGVTWPSPADSAAPVTSGPSQEGFNLGLAHGVPGVIAVLAQACQVDVASRKARPLLEQAVRWLLAQRNPEGSDCSFGTRAPTNGGAGGTRTSRLAWCYGDLGLSAALYWAAVSVNEPIWQHEALDIARRAALRPMNRAGVMDAGLCHGAAGNGHIFNRFYQATGEPLFLDAAQRWLSRAMEYYRPGQGVGGFQAWRSGVGPGGAGQWQYLPGLLEGAAGIGLALLAAISPIEPEWDRLLLVAIPPRPVGGRAV